MTNLFSIILGYLFGSVSPARWVGKRHNTDLATVGTGNLGATNTALVLGKRAGSFVLFCDVAKSFCSFRMARWLFPQVRFAGLLASIGAFLGHCFPAARKFKGGKGLAAYAGMVLAYDPVFFALILCLGCTAMFLANTGVAATVLGGTLFPVLVYLKSGCWDECLLSAAASALLLYTHRDNIKNALARQDNIKVDAFFETVFDKD